MSLCGVGRCAYFKSYEALRHVVGERGGVFGSLCVDGGDGRVREMY